MEIAVMGYGTIGSGVVKVLDMNKDLITRRAGEEVRVKYILDLRDFPRDPFGDRIIHDVDTILDDPDVKTVVETMGGTGAAYQFVKAALQAGKHVATSNKALVAKFGPELMQVAKEKNVNFYFEASVGGGIPILRCIESALAGDEIEEIAGIINGTTNYILTKMGMEGSDFQTVLKEAQELGYAEADPTDDVEGYDAGRKIAILTSMVCGHHVAFEDIHIEGISSVTAEDMKYAALMGRKMKLLALSRRCEGGFSVLAAPFLLPAEHPLSTVDGVFNAVFVTGNALGDAMFYGSGAGSLPTASAVVSDVLEIVKHPDRSDSPKWDAQVEKPQDYLKDSYSFFARVKGTLDEKEAKIEKIFGTVSYYSVGELEGEEFGFVTEKLQEGDAEEKFKKLGGVIARYRMG